jgi:glycosyltransferase involved in cell wall biosynthesis
MRKPVLTIFYQYDPWYPTIGGIQTLITSFIKYALPDLKVRLVGISSDPNLSHSQFQLGKWNPTELHGRELLFMPLFHLPNDNVRQAVPTTLKYTLALMQRQLASDFMHFHRLEPALAAFTWTGQKTLFVHNDIKQQMQSKSVANAILWKRFPRIYRLLEDLLVHQFDQVLSCYSDSAQFYQQIYPDISDRVQWIRNSVDQERFYPLTSTQRHQQRTKLAHQLRLAQDTQFILFAGRLHPQKNPLLLVQAIAALKDPRIHLLMAGEGELKEEVQSEIERLELSRQVSLLGAVNQQDLVYFYQLADIFVLTSQYEGFPVSVLEALACGTPVVTPACGEIPKLLTEQSGVIYTERSAQVVARSIRRVLSHPDQFSAQSCVYAAKPYSAQVVVNEICSEMLSTWERRISMTVAV